MKTLTILSLSALLALPASAATVVTLDFDADSAFSTWVDGTGPLTSGTLTGTADGVNFSYQVRISGTTDGTNSNLDFNDQRPLFNFDNNNVTLNATLSVINLTATSPGTIAFDGFTALSQFDNKLATGGGPDAVRVTGTTGGTETFTGTMNPESFTFATIKGGDLFVEAVDDGDNSNWRLEDLNLQFTGVAVPEPSSAVLVGLAGLGLLVRRRR
ncbi:hypothetical protein NT6N_18970 [Oceaniferula spumae]|uniref:Ice-binding protein C-terminal domain-containing protein n=1 Tax=Oceaniferula spumae TaxID=2979115 RepID=A0AAT9FLP5_9BACT